MRTAHRKFLPKSASAAGISRSAIAHQYAYNNSVYAFADDDECGTYAPYVSASTYAPYANGTTIKVTLEPF